MSRIDASVTPGMMLHSHPTCYWVKVTFTHKLVLLLYILYSPEIKWRKWESNLNVPLKSCNWSEKLKLFLLKLDHVFSVHFLRGMEELPLPVASSSQTQATIFTSSMAIKSYWLELNKQGCSQVPWEHRNSLAVISLCPLMWLCRLRLLPNQSL